MQIVLHANKLETTCWINPHSTRETVMKNSVVSEDSIWGKLPISALFPIVAIIIGLLLGGMLGRLSPYALGAVIGLIIMTLITILRQDALAAALVVVAHIYVDWYLGLLFAAQVITLLLLVIYFLARSLERPWGKPHALWLWFLFLLLGIYPTIRGTTRLYDLGFYYPNIIGGALLTFWLGTVIAKDVLSVRRFFQILAIIAALLAIHTIIQALTGNVLFGSSRFDAYIAWTLSQFCLAFFSPWLGGIVRNRVLSLTDQSPTSTWNESS